MIIACPDCNTLNRVPTERLRDAPVCGKCHAPLFRETPIVLSDVGFEAHASRAELPLLVDFWADWCGPCQMMAPHFAAAARTLEPDVRLGKVDTEAQTDLAARFGVRSIPMLVLLRAGRELARHAGAMSTHDIVTWTRAHLAR